MQPGYTKYCCFLCEWDSRARQSHYIVKEWSLRHQLTAGTKSVSCQSLVNPEKILLPPLHIKLGLMKNFVKAIVKYNEEGEGFKYLKDKFPKVSDAKIKEGIFIGPQIRELFKDLNFEACLNSVEKAAWNSFISLNENFLGTKKSPIYEEIVVTLLDAFRTMGCNMSLKYTFFTHICNSFRKI
ncbi:hypothetical protein LOD99_10248 [Oopsacas minuta]|uniref:Uncharacterized protein n=1 Tax=Oopsacas minuta TaxID=111878 RepID=A0AAV7KH47_9METZ|nr:hypothetical protein LOD99_10248 [Oopsacas minuta]